MGTFTSLFFQCKGYGVNGLADRVLYDPWLFAISSVELEDQSLRREMHATSLKSSSQSLRVSVIG